MNIPFDALFIGLLMCLLSIAYLKFGFTEKPIQSDGPPYVGEGELVKHNPLMVDDIL